MRPEKNATAMVAGTAPAHKAGKGAGQPADTAGVNGGGFMALLAMQGEDSSLVPDAVVSGGADAPVLTFAHDAVIPAALDDQGNALSGAACQTPADLAFLLLQSGNLAPGSLAPAAQIDQSGATGSNKVPASNITRVSVTDVLSESGQPETPMLPTGGKPADDMGETTTARYESRLIDGRHSAGGATLSTGATGSVLSSAESLVQAKESVRDLVAAGDRFRGNSPMEAQVRLSDAVARSKVEDLRTSRLATAADKLARTLAMEPIMVRSALDVDVLPANTRILKAQSDSAAMSPAGSFGSQLRFSADMADSPFTPSGTEVPSAEVYVAEQVKYLISNDVQSAELKLKGFDDLPIDVHISMNGKDAQVDFRTDHAEIREVLQNAELHLKDMLAKEGLVLSGVSVGTSLNDGREPRAGQQPSISRQQVVVSEESVQLAAGTHIAHRSGGAIDVFV